MKKNKKSKKNKNINVREALTAMRLLSLPHNLSEKLMVECSVDQLKNLAKPMTGQLLEARENAELIRLYMKRYIKQIDILLALVDDFKPPEQDGEEEEYDDETAWEEMADDDYPDCDGDCDHCHVYIRAVQNRGGSGQAE